MNLENSQQLEVAREKLRLLEERAMAIRTNSTDDPHIKELTLRSLTGLINQLKEEIARFEAGTPA